ncbi:MAG: response regulator transcription factor [Gallionella sp.]|jgi:DNA-binding NarL/FixJ family response regulator|nr:response regulator transcription factor [Gallionella sp.]MCK9354302.1 response regulator transcription factor [Gallionella sp.]
MIRLVMADDHPVVREITGYVLALAPDVELVGEAVNGEEVLNRVRDGQFDLLLLDMNMPGISGVELIERVKLCRATLPILVYTMHNDVQVAMRVIKAGASGLLTKDSDPEQLLAAIRKVSAGGKYLDPAVVEQIAMDFESSNLQLPQTSLADREMEVFRLLVEGK